MTTNRQCRHCAAFVTHGSWCYEWRKDVSPTYSCSRWHSATGVDGAEWPVMLRVSIEEDRVIEDRRQEGIMVDKQTEDRKMELLQLIIDEGLSQKEAGKRVGYTPGGVASTLSNACEADLIRRVGYGKYEWVKEPIVEETSDVHERLQMVEGLTDEIRQDLDTLKNQHTKLMEDVGNMVERLRDLVKSHAELEERYIDVAEGVDALEAAVPKLEQVVEELDRQVGTIRHGHVGNSRAIAALEADMIALRPDDAITIGPVTVRGPVDRETLAQAVAMLAQSAMGGRSA